VAGRLVVVEDSDRPFLTRSLRVPDRVASFLVGNDEPDSQVASLVYTCAAAPGAGVRALERWMRGEPKLAYVREPPGAAAAPHAVSAAMAAGRRALTVDLRRIRPEDDAAALAGVVVREALLTGSVVIAGPLEALVARGVSAVQAFAESRVTVVLTGAGNWDPGWAREVPFLGEAHALGEVRGQLWTAAIDGALAGGVDAAEATAQFRLVPEQIKRAAQAARLQAEAAGRTAEGSDLTAGARPP